VTEERRRVDQRRWALLIYASGQHRSEGRRRAAPTCLSCVKRTRLPLPLRCLSSISLAFGWSFFSSCILSICRPFTRTIHPFRRCLGLYTPQLGADMLTCYHFQHSRLKFRCWTFRFLASFHPLKTLLNPVQENLGPPWAIPLLFLGISLPEHEQ
jgi:hypothetical protein